MAITRKPTAEETAYAYRNLLQPYIQDESAVKGLQRFIGPNNEMTREGMYHLEILNNLISSNNGTEKVFQRIPPEVFGGLSEGGRRNVQASLIARSLQGTDKTEQRRIDQTGYTKIQQIIGQWAERDGSWSDTPEGDLIKKGYHHNPSDDGSEARVFDPENSDTIIKTIDFSHYSDFELMLDRITIHNATFPEMAMTVRGFGMRDDAEDNTGFVIIVSQPKAEGNVPTMEQIKDGMEQRFFDRSENGFFWINGLDNIVICDIHDQNAVMSPGGNLLVFDCEAFLKLFPVQAEKPERYSFNELKPGRTGKRDTEAWKRLLGDEYNTTSEQQKSVILKTLRTTGAYNGLEGKKISIDNPETKFLKTPDGKIVKYYDGPILAGSAKAFNKEHLWTVPEIQYKDNLVEETIRNTKALMPREIDLEEFLYNKEFVGDLTSKYYGGADYRKYYRDQLKRTGRINELTNNRYLVQLNPQDPTKVLISTPEKVGFMLWTNNTENESLPGGRRLTNQDREELLKGNSILFNGNEITFDLDKGRLESTSLIQQKLRKWQKQTVEVEKVKAQKKKTRMTI